MLPGYDPCHRARKDSVNERAEPVRKASRPEPDPPWRRLLRVVGAAETRPNGANMSVAIFVVLTIALFAVLGLIQKAVERL